MKQWHGRLSRWLISLVLSGFCATAIATDTPTLDIVFENSTYWLGNPTTPTPLTDAPPEPVAVYITPKIEFTPVVTSDSSPEPSLAIVSTNALATPESEIPALTPDASAHQLAQNEASLIQKSCPSIKNCKCRTVLKDKITDCDREPKKIKTKVCKCTTKPDAQCIAKQSTTTEPVQLLGASHEND